MVNLPISKRYVGNIPDSLVLYRAYLVPNKADLLRDKVDENLAEKIIYRIIDGGETSVIAAKPMPYNLIKLYDDAGLTIPPMIKQKLDKYGFYLIHLICTFRSHEDTPHPFVWGEMKAKFSNLTGPEEPTVFDLCPSSVSDTAHIEKEYGLSASANFIGISLSGQHKSIVKFDRIIPIITSFGKYRSEAIWEYTTSMSQSEIKGDYEGAVILMFPKDDKIKVTLDIKAKVKEQLSAKFLKMVKPHSGKWTNEDFIGKDEMELPLYRAVPITEKELSVPIHTINTDNIRRYTSGFGDSINYRQDLSENDKSLILNHIF